MKFREDLFYPVDKWLSESHPELLKDEELHWLHSQAKLARIALEGRLEKVLEGKSEATKLIGTLGEEVKDLHKKMEFVPELFTRGFYTEDFDSEMQQFIESYYDYFYDEEWSISPCNEELWYNEEYKRFEVDGCLIKGKIKELTKDEFKLKIGMPL